uniref:RNA-directed RNA polymerase n=1 Tax=Hubei levi-like virus 9 TaxID=1922921 RepID=A0A1L3KIG6_9VIRU|nr:hypothetical protein [Hubei levi-like virus 9]
MTAVRSKRLNKRDERWASLEDWRNSKTSLTCDRVAEAYATSNLRGELLSVALNVVSLFREDAGKAKKLASEVAVTEFGDASQCFVWQQFKALLLKSTAGSSTLKLRKDAAWNAFLKAEARCSITNKRLRYYWSRPERENPLYRVILARARESIREVLGEFTPATLRQLISLSRPGSGGSIGTRNRDAVAPAFKYGHTDLVTTRKALPYARMLVEGSLVWVECSGKEQEDGTWNLAYYLADANRVSMVPKDSTTERTIAVEPHLNMCLQLGVHEWVASRLRSFGVDIRSQTRNQQMAHEASTRWEHLDPLVTLDLSAASDSVSRSLVERLLPSCWLSYLDDIRCDRYRVGSDTYEYHKWSSMGNGYTFVLETLIFWAIARACLSLTTSQARVSVYGDDIIVPRGCAAQLIEVLKYSGFRVNTDKSFCFGPFRESCGEDFFSGDRVVPVYLRGVKHLRPTDIYRLINRLTEDERHDACLVKTLALEAHKGIPIVHTLRNSDYCSGLFSDSIADLKRQRHCVWSARYQAWSFRRASFRPDKVHAEAKWLYATALRGASEFDLVKRGDYAKLEVKRKGSWTLVSVISG